MIPAMIDEMWEDPETIRRMGLAFLDAVLNYWQSTPAVPVHPEVTPEDFSAITSQAMPERGEPFEKILADCRRWIGPGLTRVASPRYLGMMNPSPALPAVFAESLAAAFNQNCSLWHQSPAAAELEKTVIRWLCEIIGLEAPAPFGILVSGGSIANITALKLARDHALAPDTRREGLRGSPALTFYVSEEGHYSFEKGMDFLGLGTRHLRRVPADDQFRMIPEKLRRMIQEDRRAGLKPACVVGIAGTTNTGSLDRLDELGAIARENGLWYHVDGAYGGAAAMLPQYRDYFAGAGRADSVTMDPHKWFFVPFEGAALLVKDGERLRSGFTTRPDYYLEQGDGRPEKVNYFEYGLQGSRSFKALKIWFTLKSIGMEGYRTIIGRNIRFASQLYEFISRDPDFEPFHQPELGMLCFRIHPQSWRAAGTDSGHRLDRLNRAIHRRIELDGRFWISMTRLRENALSLRVNFQNYRTRDEDVAEFCRYLARLRQEEVDHDIA